MKFKVIIGLFAFAFSGNSWSGDDVLGKWNCLMDSEYGEFVFDLTFNDDGSFMKRVDMWGKVEIDEGSWRIEKNALKFHRTKITKGDEEKASDFKYEREIVSSSASELVLKHDETITTCKLAE